MNTTLLLMLFIWRRSSAFWMITCIWWERRRTGRPQRESLNNMLKRKKEHEIRSHMNLPLRQFSLIFCLLRTTSPSFMNPMLNCMKISRMKMKNKGIWYRQKVEVSISIEKAISKGISKILKLMAQNMMKFHIVKPQPQGERMGILSKYLKQNCRFFWFRQKSFPSVVISSLINYLY